MLRCALNLTMLFTEVPFLERFAAARRAGARYVEFQFPYDHPAEAIRERIAAACVTPVLFNLPAGDWGAGDRGIAADPNRVEEFRQGVDRAVAYARTLGVRKLNLLAGKAVESAEQEAQWRTLVENLRHAAGRLRDEGIDLMVEPFNPYDIPGAFLADSRTALRLLDEAAAPNAYLQYDIYHMYRSEGGVAETLERILPRIGHIQFADVPGRHQPGTGEIDFPLIMGRLEELGYGRFVSAEYIPAGETAASLGWLERLNLTLGGEGLQ